MKIMQKTFMFESTFYKAVISYIGLTLQEVYKETKLWNASERNLNF